jgi:hypothetical protein
MLFANPLTQADAKHKAKYQVHCKRTGHDQQEDFQVPLKYSVDPGLEFLFEIYSFIMRPLTIL